LSSCFNVNSSHNTDLAIKGEVIFLGLGGRIQYSNKYYEPINLSENFKNNGLNILVTAVLAENIASYRMGDQF